MRCGLVPQGTMNLKIRPCVKPVYLLKHILHLQYFISQTAHKTQMVLEGDNSDPLWASAPSWSVTFMASILAWV